MPETQAILDAFRRVFRALRLNAHETQNHCGLSGAQLFVLQKIGAQESLSVNEIAARTNTDQSSVSVVISKLVAKGFLSREPCASDRRKSLLSITPDGSRIVSQSPQLVQDRLLHSIKALSKTEQVQLSQLINKVVQGAALSSEPPTLFFEDDQHESTRSPSTRPRRASRRQPHSS